VHHWTHAIVVQGSPSFIRRLDDKLTDADLLGHSFDYKPMDDNDWTHLITIPANDTLEQMSSGDLVRKCKRRCPLGQEQGLADLLLAVSREEISGYNMFDAFIELITTRASATRASTFSDKAWCP
jgi:hypothetical protein